jgi:signal transduction histidine kinase
MLKKLIRKIAISSNISDYLSRTLVVITVTTTLLIGGVLIIQQSLHYNKINKQKGKEYLENQKTYIQDIVKNELEYIRIQNEIFKQNINEEVRNNVMQAFATAEAIYQKYAGIKSDDEIQYLIIASISSLRFDMEYEEVFISSLNGTGVYYPRKPEFTGKNMLHFKDANGSSVVLDEINLLKSKDEGFLSCIINSDINSKSSSNKKTSFVKKFGHFNWYFGSKQYVEDYFPKFRNEIAQKISTVRFKYGGYVFMNSLNGSPIVMDGAVYKGNLNLITDTVNVRHRVFMQELDVLKTNPDGGFFYYQWNKMNDSIPSEKCSYVQLFKEYNWLIGAGFYLDEINQSIKDQKRKLWEDQKSSILTILLILILLLFLEGIIISRFNKRYKSDFERFFSFFYTSQNNFNQLNISELNFDEFRRAGIAANEMITLREETEKRLLQEHEKAMESDRLKSAFLANMSHEIRTPMNAILGFSELLESDNLNEKDKLVYVKQIQKNGDMLLNLIHDIMDISKIEANLLSIGKRPVRLSKFMEDISNHYTEILSARKDKDIHFQINNEVNQEVLIQTDEIRLRQVIDNLLGNAIKFTSSGSILVDVKLEADLIHFHIKDTGIGIPLDQQATIFERFFQADQGEKINIRGTGLGLAISKNLIQLLGGSIQLKSEFGKGSTFSFYIPKE